MVAVYFLLIFVGLYGSTHRDTLAQPSLICTDKCFKLGTFVNKIVM